jgi:hypothetical protein
MTPDELLKLQKGLIAARDRQAPAGKAKGGTTRAEPALDLPPRKDAPAARPKGSIEMDRRGSGPRSHRRNRSQARRPRPAGFSFAFIGRADLFALPIKPILLWRVGWIRSGKSGGPSLFEPSLKVQRDNTYNQTPGCRPGLKTSTRALL